MSDSEHPPDTTPHDAQHVGKSNSPVAAGKSASRRELLAALTATDVTIRRLDLLLSSADGQERVLATVNYVASILHHLCASAPWIALQTRLGILARLRGNTASPSPSKPSPSKWAALSSLASETRYNLRLFGLLPLWIWGSDTLKNPIADPVIHALTILQVISNVIYQFLENVPYLASKGVISKKWINKYGGIDLWYIWSTRGWFGHIFFQFFVLWRQHVLRKRRMAAKRAAGNVETEELKAEEKEELREEIRSWKKSLVNNTIWAPLCVHWCFEKGIGIPENLIGLFSLMAGAWGLRDSWAATAKA
ncbi:Peroxisomal biogenesis factor 11 [Penicillium malachiteum]|uniref:Peroxisomal biogenesis factor 11 n=1 Tax=Penicillium malachiteum TaxID=1324776 RepID=A0AAD6HEH3_9EURO|nr:Peroxisomal biogenesis factor 11 [Penicillium malachiteum]